MKITKIMLSLFAITLLSSFTIDTNLSSNTFGIDLEGKSGVKMLNTSANRILGVDSNGNLALYPNDGIGQSKAAKWDYMAVNYRNKEAGIYIFLSGSDQVMTRKVNGEVVLSSFSSLNTCETEMARWDYGVMMTGGEESVRYQFESKSSFEGMRAMFVGNNKVQVTDGEFEENTMWKLDEGSANRLKVTPKR